MLIYTVSEKEIGSVDPENTCIFYICPVSNGISTIPTNLEYFDISI